MHKIILLSILLLTSAIPASFAQRGTIRGTVLDADNGQPLVGTTIVIEGTTLGTTANADGSFTISNIVPGPCSIYASYLGYEIFRTRVMVVADTQVDVDISLSSKGVDIENVIVIAKIDHESEHVVLSEQREAVVATQSVSAMEMSRKGISNAELAVAQVSGVSKQESVKNVFVRGLGDRYNTTFLNGFPVSSEDPEYKNIALESFGADVIQNIGVQKVFAADNNGDVAGAVIDLRSKELMGEGALSVSLGAGINTTVPGARLLRQDGVNYWGCSRSEQPADGIFGFANSLDPKRVRLPLNHSFGISGGKLFELGPQANRLSFFVTASQSSDYNFTTETVRNANAGGTIYQDQRGEKSSINTSQLVLGNADYRIGLSHRLSYNFMMVHTNQQYVGEYNGLHTERHQDSDDGTGYLRRQQNNDNLLLTHQLITRWSLAPRFVLDAGAAYNTIRGLEPDRRENYLSHQADGLYILTGSNRQKRFFSALDEDDLNLRASLSYKLRRDNDIEKSNVTLGYRGRLLEDNFAATEYNFGRYPGTFALDGLELDNLYNDANFGSGIFTVVRGDENTYRVKKNIHSAYLSVTHQLWYSLTFNAGFQVDLVDMSVDHHVQHVAPGKESIDKIYYLPSLGVKYDISESHSLRLGASLSYTLPQSKEISPYQYVNISYTSQGNPNLKPSDNLNLDLKWDWYISSSELVSLGAFYKHITDPIGRVDQGNSAGLLTYDNISPRATVAGIEFELRKNIFTLMNRSRVNRLSVGVNASYIYSNLQLEVANTERRSTQLEGASPLLFNGDITYRNTFGTGREFTLSVVAGYFSDRIFTLGTQSFNDTMEKSVVNLAATASFKLDRLTLKVKAGNLLNPRHRLTRKVGQTDNTITLNEFRKGADFSIGVSFNL